MRVPHIGPWVSWWLAHGYCRSMPYLFLLLFPLAMAGGCALLRAQPRLLAWASFTTVLIEVILVLQAPTGESVRLLGVPLLLGSYSQLLLVALLGMIAGCQLGWTDVPARSSAIVGSLVLLSLIAALALIQATILAVVLLLVAGIISVLLELAHTDTDAGIIRNQLVLVMAGGSCALIGLALRQSDVGGLAVSAVLQIVGLGFWVWMFPWHLARAGAGRRGLIPGSASALGGLSLLALLLGVRLLAVEPSLVSDRRVEGLALGGIGLVMVAAPLLAGRGAFDSVALIFAANGGQLGLGLVLGSPASFRSVLAGLPVQALAVALIACSGLMPVAEDAAERRGGRQYPPLALTAVAVGLLALVGLPPLGGWMSKALLWQAARQHGLGALVIAVVSHAVLLVGVSRVFGDMLRRVSSAESILPDHAPSRGDPIAHFDASVWWDMLLRRSWIIVLIAVVAGAGLFPGLILAPVDAALIDLDLPRGFGGLP